MRVRSAVKNISSGLIGQMLLIVANFLTRTIFIQILGSTYLGVSGLFGNILSLLSLAELGVGQAITYSLYKPIAENNYDKINTLMAIYKKIYRYIFIFVFVVGLSLTPFLKYIIKDIDKIANIRVIYMMYVVNSAVSYLFIYKGVLITASQKNYITNKISYSTSIIMMVLQISVLLLFKNYLLYLGIQITVMICQNIFIAHTANKLYPILKTKTVIPLNKEESSTLKKNIGSLMIYKIGTLALNSTTNILISTFVGLIKVGIYSNYFLICSSINSFLSTIFGNLTASIGNFNASETTEKKVEMFRVINLATFWLYGVSSICLFCAVNPLINVWIGKEYLLNLREVFVIVLNAYIAGMLFAPYNYRQTMGLFVYGKMRPIISAVINIVASVILGKYYGLEGILWGTIIARVTTNVWFDPYIVFVKGLGQSPMWYFSDYIIKLVLVMLSGMGCFFITRTIPDTTILDVILKAIIAFVLSNFLFFVCYGKSKEFKYLFNTFKIIVFRGKNK